MDMAGPLFIEYRMGIFYNRQRKKARVKNWGWTADGGCGIINSGFDAPVVKLADTMDLGSIPATGRGSSPLGRTRKRGQKRFLVKKLRDFKTSEALG